MFLVLGPCTYLFTVVIQPASFRECELLRAVGMNGGYTMTSKSMPLSHSIQVFIKSKSQHDFLPSLTCFIPDFVLPDSMRTGSLSRKYGYQNHIELFYMWGKMHRNIHAILIFITTTQHTHTETHTHTFREWMGHQKQHFEGWILSFFWPHVLSFLFWIWGHLPVLIPIVIPLNGTFEVMAQDSLPFKYKVYRVTWVMVCQTRRSKL